MLDSASSGYQTCLRELRNICGIKLTLPTSYTLSLPVLKIGHGPIPSGSLGDVFEGVYNDSKIRANRVRVDSKGGPWKAAEVRYPSTFPVCC